MNLHRGYSTKPITRLNSREGNRRAAPEGCIDRRALLWIGAAFTAAPILGQRFLERALIPLPDPLSALAAVVAKHRFRAPRSGLEPLRTRGPSRVPERPL